MNIHSVTKTYAILCILWFTAGILISSFLIESIFLKTASWLLIFSNIFSIFVISKKNNLFVASKERFQKLVFLVMVILAITSILLWIVDFRYNINTTSSVRFISLVIVSGIWIFSLAAWLIVKYYKNQ